jgi:hypothetical protein
MKTWPKEIAPISREIVERIARIIGPTSAAQLALDELDQRVKLGEHVCIFETASSFVVGPAPADYAKL